MKKPLIIPFFIAHAGCPFTCVYCNQWKISGEETQIKPEEIDGFVETYLQKAKLWEGRYIEIAFYGGSFTALPEETQIAFLRAAFEQKKKGRVHGLRLSTRPDYLDRQIVERLLAYGVTTVELGVQSLVDEVLAETGRGHSVADVTHALKLLREYPLQVGIQLMLGLPGDSTAFARLTAQRTVELGPDFVRIYPTLVLKETELEKWYKEGRYTPWSLQTALEMAAYWLGVFSYYKIPVIRLGLQAVENLSLEKDLVAGPYHPAFGELVESQLMLEQIEKGLQELLPDSGEKGSGGEQPVLKISFSPCDYSKVVGHKKRNICFLQEKYNLREIKLNPQGYLGENDLEISNTLQMVQVKRQDFLERYRII